MNDKFNRRSRQNDLGLGKLQKVLWKKQNTLFKALTDCWL